MSFVKITSVLGHRVETAEQLVALGAPPAVPYLAAHWSATRPFRTLIGTDEAHWRRTWRCDRCGESWTEECVTSGHAELYYGYPASEPSSSGPSRSESSL